MKNLYFKPDVKIIQADDQTTPQLMFTEWSHHSGNFQYYYQMYHALFQRQLQRVAERFDTLKETTYYRKWEK